MLCMEQTPTQLCWRPAPHLSSCLMSNPSHSCPSQAPLVGSQSVASGGGGPELRIHRVACQEPQAGSLMICSRQAGRQVAPGSGGPHFFACQFLTSGDERSGAQGGVRAVAPTSLSPGRLCTSPPTATAQGPGLGRSALDSETQTSGCL